MTVFGYKRYFRPKVAYTLVKVKLIKSHADKAWLFYSLYLVSCYKSASHALPYTLPLRDKMNI